MEVKPATEGHLAMPPYLKPLDYVGALSRDEMKVIDKLSSNDDVIMHNMPVKLPVICRGILQHLELTKDVCLIIAPYPAYVLEIVTMMKKHGGERSVKVETCDVINANHMSTFEATDTNVAVGTPRQALDMVMNGIFHIDMVFFYSGNEVIDNDEADAEQAVLLNIVEPLEKFQRKVQIVFFSERVYPGRNISWIQNCFPNMKVVHSSECIPNMEDVHSSESVVPLKLKDGTKHMFKVVTEEKKWDEIWIHTCKTLGICSTIDSCEIDIHNTLDLAHSHIRAIIYVDDVCSRCSGHVAYWERCFGPYGRSRPRRDGFYDLPFLTQRRIKVPPNVMSGNVVRNLLLNNCVLVASRILVRDVIEFFADKVEMVINCSTVNRVEYLQRVCSFPNVSTAVTFATKGELYKLESLQGSCDFTFEDRDYLFEEIYKKDLKDLMVDANGFLCVPDLSKSLAHKKKRMRSINEYSRLKTGKVASRCSLRCYNTARDIGIEVKRMDSALKTESDVIVHMLEPGVVEAFWGAILNHSRMDRNDSLVLVIVPNQFYISKIVQIVEAFCCEVFTQLQVETLVTIISGRHKELGTPVRVAVGMATGVIKMLLEESYCVDMAVFYWGNESTKSGKERTMSKDIKRVVYHIDYNQESYFKQTAYYRIVIFSEKEMEKPKLFKEFMRDPMVIISKSSECLHSSIPVLNDMSHKCVVAEEVERVDSICDIIVRQSKSGKKKNTIVYVEARVVYDSLIEKLNERGISTTKIKARMSHEEMNSAVLDFVKETHVLVTPRIWAREIIPRLGKHVEVVIYSSTVKPRKYFLGLYLFEKYCTAFLFVTAAEMADEFILLSRYAYGVKFEKFELPGREGCSKLPIRPWISYDVKIGMLAIPSSDGCKFFSRKKLVAQ